MAKHHLLIVLVALAFLLRSFSQAAPIHGLASLERHALDELEEATKRYEGAEHRAGANAYGYLTLMLQPGGQDPVPNYNNQDIRVNFSTPSFVFKNANNVSLFTYGDIVAIAGDFFGATAMGQVICSGADNHEEKENLFQSAFRQLWINQKDNTVLELIKKLIDAEDLELRKLKQNEQPWKIFASMGEARWLALLSTYMSTFYDLLLNNLDHFGQCAVDAYTAGHKVAMGVARQAGAEFSALPFANLSLEARGAALATARAQLEKAYAMNAFADHFLTDLFAAGHIRTPRRFLVQTCSDLSVAGLVSQWMHDEDNRNGLWVQNDRGDVWKTYGDDSFFDVRNAASRAILIEAVQISRNEVYSAFNGAADPEQPAALHLIPNPDLLSRYAIKNTCPLFIRDPSLKGNVLTRYPADVVRPPAWRYQNASLSTSCDYQPFDASSCPSSAKWEKLKAWVFDHSMRMDQSADAWVTTEYIPPPQPEGAASTLSPPLASLLRLL